MNQSQNLKETRGFRNYPRESTEEALCRLCSGNKEKEIIYHPQLIEILGILRKYRVVL